MKTEFQWAVGCVVLLAGGERTAAQSWVSTTAPVLSWNWVAASADGLRLIAAAPTGPIHISTNSGLNWTATSSPSNGWSSVTSSADGEFLAASSQANMVCVSTNAGETWAYGGTGGLKVTASADGRKLVVLLGGLARSSTNSGSTWSIGGTLPNQNWATVRSSADGSKVVAAARNGGIYTSWDSGTNWMSNALPNQPWSSVACSADGVGWVAAAGMKNGAPGPIYRSTNSGAA
ncbi:MAG: hypothetical protein KJ044_16730 [Planctomycetes bacterium]|nr:hypothetical protein [Planctomycetota bacterium]